MGRKPKCDEQKLRDKLQGMRIYECRELKKISRRELGRLVGISESGLRFTEQGNRTASPELISNLAICLDVKKEYLNGDDKFEAATYKEFLSNLYSSTLNDIKNYEKGDGSLDSLIKKNCLEIESFYDELLSGTRFSIEKVIPKNNRTSNLVDLIENDSTLTAYSNSKYIEEKDIMDSIRSVSTRPYCKLIIIKDNVDGCIYEFKPSEFVDLMKDIKALATSRLDTLLSANRLVNEENNINNYDSKH